MSSVADVMTGDKLLSVEPTTTVAEAATMMGERRAGSALVMRDGKLAGIFTERDVVRALGQHFDAAGHPVSEWMTPDPVTVPPETDARAALKIMLDGGFRHLPVVVDDQVVGIVSIRDLSSAGIA